MHPRSKYLTNKIQLKLHSAVQRGDLGAVAKFVAKYGDNSTMMNSMPLTHHVGRQAYKSEHVLFTVVDKILAHHSQPAKQNNYFNILLTLLSAKAISLNCKNIYFNTPLLHYVVSKEFSFNLYYKSVVEVLKILLNDARAATDSIYNDQCLLTYAISHPSPNCAEILASNKHINVNTATNESGTTPLMALSRRSSMPKVIRILLNDRPDLDLNRTSNDGKTALEYALFQKNHDLALQLLARKDVGTKTRQPILLFAIDSNNNEDVINAIIEREDVDINAADESGITPLMKICKIGHIEIAKKLLAQTEVNTLAISQSHENALMYAAWNNHLDILNLLLQRPEMDTVINAVNVNSHSTLLLAARRDHTNIALRLLDTEKCDVQIANKDGDTALLFAVRNQNLELTRALLQRKADPNHANVNGERALDEAVKISNSKICSQIVDLLLQYGAEIDPVNPKTGISTSELALNKGNQGIAMRLLRREYGLQKTITLMDHSLFNQKQSAQADSQSEEMRIRP